jgi:hypothetical protein
MDHGSIATRFALGGAGGGPSTSAVAIALTVGILLLALLGTAWFVLTQFSHGGRGADDDDANPGPGGGGSGRPPNGPSGPTSEPEWWGEFERQFAAHVRSQSQTADAHSTAKGHYAQSRASVARPSSRTTEPVFPAGFR